MKTFLFIVLLGFALVNSESKLSIRHQLKQKLIDTLEKLKEEMNEQDKEEGVEDRYRDNLKRLKKAGEFFKKCNKKIGKVSRVTDMIYSNDADSPITIKQIPSYVELDMDDFQLWNDNFKTEQYIDFKLENIEKLTIPKSFRQPGYEVNCFQMNENSKRRGKIQVDYDKEEPYTAIDADLTLCFKDEKSMKEWIDAILDFYQNCGVSRYNNPEIEEKVQEETEDIGNVGKKIEALMETLNTLKNQFTVIEQQNEYQDKKMKEKQEEMEIEKKDRQKRIDQIKQQDEQETKDYSGNKSCDEHSKDEMNQMEEQERAKLEGCKSADDINYEDIEKNNNLSDEDKQKLKAKRFELFQQVKGKSKIRMMKQKVDDQQQQSEVSDQSSNDQQQQQQSSNDQQQQSSNEQSSNDQQQQSDQQQNEVSDEQDPSQTSEVDLESVKQLLSQLVGMKKMKK